MDEKKAPVIEVRVSFGGKDLVLSGLSAPDGDFIELYDQDGKVVQPEHVEIGASRFLRRPRIHRALRFLPIVIVLRT